MARMVEVMLGTFQIRRKKLNYEVLLQKKASDCEYDQEIHHHTLQKIKIVFHAVKECQTGRGFLSYVPLDLCISSSIVKGRAVAQW